MNVGELFVRMALDSKPYEKSIDQMRGVTEKHAATLGGVFKNAFSFAIGIGIMQGFRSLTVAVTDFVNTAARTDVLNIAMQSVARSSGYAVAALNQQKNAVMDLGIAEQEATQVLTRFMQAELDTADAAKLARVAQDAAVIANMNSSQAAEQMTEAVAKLRPELLEQFGMTKNLMFIYRDYAKTLGKNYTELTEMQKKQAMLNYLLSEGQKIAGTYEASMGAVGKQIGSLPRFWDTLKNAIAKPLALPALSIIVDGITNSLKSAIGWAEANKATLQSWGQTAANVAGAIIQGFKYVVRIFIDNWAVIKFATVAILTYTIASKAAAGAVALFNGAVLLLSGNLVANTGLLGFLNSVIVSYRGFVSGAAVTTNVFSGALVRLRAALIAVETAIGPIGWVLIGLSLLTAGGVALWDRYNQSLQKTPKVSAGVTDATGKTTSALNDQAEALKKSTKAAGKNLQTFDEIHQLQKDTAAATGAEDLSGALGGAGGFELPSLDFEGMLEGMEPAKASLRGFWDWLKENYGSIDSKIPLTWKWGEKLWDWLGVDWDNEAAYLRGRMNAFVDWCKGIPDRIRNDWAWFTNWVHSWADPLWDGVKAKWSNFTEWCADLWDGAKTKWGNFKQWAGDTWEGIKTNIQTRLDNLKTRSGETWDNIKTTAQTKWDNLKASAGKTWGNIKTTIQEKWEDLKKDAPKTWDNIKTNIQDRWNALKKDAPTTWDNIRTAITTRWDKLKADAPTTWDNIKTTIQTRWNALKSDAPTTWESIKQSIVSKFDAARSSLGNIGEAIKSNVSSQWSNIASTIRGWASTLYSNITSPWENARSTISNLVSNARDWGSNLIQNIINGIQSKVSSLRSSLSNVGDTIKGYLGFSSPTEKGPGRTADQWAPALMQMYARGILGGSSDVRSAVDTVAGYLSGLTATVAPTVEAGVAGAGGGLGEEIARDVAAMLRGMQPAAAGAGGDIIIPLYIGNDLLERKIVKAQDVRNARSNGKI